MQNRILWLILMTLSACAPVPIEPDFSLAPSELKSGLEFMSEESQMEQSDDFSNPGFLWVSKGKALFADGEKPCLSCHTDPEAEFKHTPLTYPKIHKETGALINIEGRINLCRTKHQGQESLPYESENLLALTSYVKKMSIGQTIAYDITEDLRPHFDAGKNYFYQRRGQLNLSCHQCHDQNWGKKMRGDTVSQGHINGFPAYRNDWQTLGSTHRRFEACDIGVKAQPHELGADSYLALEVYLMARGSGLLSETPALRR